MAWKYVIAGLTCLSVVGCSQKSESETAAEAEKKVEAITEVKAEAPGEAVTKEGIEEKTGSLCDVYAEQTGLQLAAYQSYCRTESPDVVERLFPEYIWCTKLDPPVDCAGAAEQTWCEAQGEAKATELIGQRDKRTEECQKAYEAAFDKTGSDMAALVPEGEVVLESDVSAGRLAPIEQDFNGDQHPDRLFVTGKLVDGKPPTENLRLMVALSQADGSLKTLPVAPLWLSNNEPEYGAAQSKLVLDGKDGFQVSTTAIDHNKWDSYTEYRFRFANGQFVLQQELAGYTEVAYEDTPGAGSSSTITDYEKGVILRSDTERCDLALNAGEVCQGAEEESIPTDLLRPILANFLE